MSIMFADKKIADFFFFFPELQKILALWFNLQK